MAPSLGATLDAMPTMSKRTLRLALGVAWLIDAGLQFQPFMFTRAFSDDVLAGAASDQPRFVATPVQWAADAVGAHPFAWNLLFALLQLTIAAALLVLPDGAPMSRGGRAIKPALLVSIGWALSLWYLGEGLGGIAGPSAWLLTGAPGAALIYVVLSAAAWPAPASRLPWWLPLAWAGYWVGGAVLHLLNGPTRGPDLAAAIAAGANGSPGWVTRLDFSLARSANTWNELDIALLIALQLLIGVAVFAPRPVRNTGLAIGAVVALAFWFVGQQLGQLTSGHATDVNTGPLIVLLAAATFATGTRRYDRGSNALAVGRRTSHGARSRRVFS
ncbi:MAG TPA: hypothetical protein VIL94_03915 [Acidothermaceae bacterium]